ncbi:kynureninase [Mesorhizobium sp. M7A.F.Ca.US.006.04.2.1]|uniref:kynureninase n=2 Tax=Mesorhizobium TaxID=68287 RepID=UPI000FCC2613|nr:MULTISPECIES: kynureninase [unclassified Mesorhizobium]MBZ9717569.1 kynureninase [Mesorhizobium sp. AD1-1]RUX72699.1 kynureninase [Mesorhizobium sp. M7A.F.Ca.US.005.03.1.1]RUY26751.1 kynureninase [Mesorhizobium sp. M7A.F.Ca.US.001.04.2.1]RUY42617.1 kynureninase [Mesorhizobium sp. M7A.F.Ca.US.001.04.1.1]RUZ99415.1 kynureninase [Mesorhizobium sp. M7A.F.Ca.US.001.02.1.1]
MSGIPDLAAVEAMDATDPLRAMRDRFILPEGVIYLDGNSLGAASHAVFGELQQAATQEWARDLIRAWNTAGWFEMPIELGDQLGRLIGAAAGQTVVCDTTSTNIYKVLHAAMEMRPGRSAIVAEGDSFPTDLYIAEGVASTRDGVLLRLAGVDAPTIEELIDENVAVVLVNHVNYKSGELRDMAALTRRAHAAGALIVWDLCHTAGALPVELDQANADFAVGCTYKYLNGGPGAPAFIYAAQRHHGDISQPLSGWWGHARPFAFERGYVAGAGIRRFLCGTQPVLSMRALKGALAIWSDVDMAALRKKSVAQTELFIQLVEAKCGAYGLALETTRDATRRGSQVSFLHDHGYQIMRALIERGVIGDFRAPSTIRFGFTPLYVSYKDVWLAVEVLEDILRTGAWKDQRFAVKEAVT